jgi:hypothetical protein
MIRTARTAARRVTLTFAMAGAVAFGTVALAPAASAAQPDVDGSYYTIDGPDENGPEDFLVGPHGRTPVFYCDPAKPNQLHTICQDDPDSGQGRF